MLKIAATINRAHKETSGVCVVLENVAGGVGHHSADADMRCKVTAKGIVDLDAPQA